MNYIQGDQIKISFKDGSSLIAEVMTDDGNNLECSALSKNEAYKEGDTVFVDKVNDNIEKLNFYRKSKIIKKSTEYIDYNGRQKAIDNSGNFEDFKGNKNPSYIDTLKYIPKDVSIPDLTFKRVQNGFCEILNGTGWGILKNGDVGIITEGAYKGLKGRLLYCARDGSDLYNVIEVLEGKDKNVTMCYQIGSKDIISKNKLSKKSYNSDWNKPLESFQNGKTVNVNGSEYEYDNNSDSILDEDEYCGNYSCRKKIFHPENAIQYGGELFCSENCKDEFEQDERGYRNRLSKKSGNEYDRYEEIDYRDGEVYCDNCGRRRYKKYYIDDNKRYCDSKCANEGRQKDRKLMYPQGMKKKSKRFNWEFDKHKPQWKLNKESMEIDKDEDAITRIGKLKNKLNGRTPYFEKKSIKISHYNRGEKVLVKLTENTDGRTGTVEGTIVNPSSGNSQEVRYNVDGVETTKLKGLNELKKISHKLDSETSDLYKSTLKEMSDQFNHYLVTDEPDYLDALLINAKWIVSRIGQEYENCKYSKQGMNKKAKITSDNIIDWLDKNVDSSNVNNVKFVLNEYSINFKKYRDDLYDIDGNDIILYNLYNDLTGLNNGDNY